MNGHIRPYDFKEFSRPECLIYVYFAVCVLGNFIGRKILIILFVGNLEFYNFKVALNEISISEGYTVSISFLSF